MAKFILRGEQFYPPNFDRLCRGLAVEMLEVMKPILDISARQWPRRGLTLGPMLQTMYSLVIHAGFMSAALRSNPGTVCISMPMPGDSYNFRRMVEYANNVEDLEKFPTNAVTKKADDNVDIRILVPLLPFIRRGESSAYDLTGVLSHGCAVTYEVTTRDTARQAKPYSKYNPLAWFWTCFTARNIYAFLVYMLSLCLAIFLVVLAVQVFYPAKQVGSVWMGTKVTGNWFVGTWTTLQKMRHDLPTVRRAMIGF